MGSRSSFS